MHLGISKIVMLPLQRESAMLLRACKDIFTVEEVPPAFPGGTKSLASYMKKFCRDHAAEIKEVGYGDIEVYFVVHFKGQRDGYLHRIDYPESKFDLAVKCIKEGPDWIRGKQNGYPVIAYAQCSCSSLS